MHTTCPNSFCNYKFADLHDDDSTHVIIYCQNCGYEAKHARRNVRKMEKPQLIVMPGGGTGAGKKKKKKARPSDSLRRAG